MNSEQSELIDEAIELATRPCVGCGFCCMKAPCSAAVRIYGSGLRHCPELRWDEKMSRYICRLVTLPNSVGERYRQELYIGVGCCSSLNSWRNHVRQRNGIEDNDDFARLTPSVSGVPDWVQMFMASLGQQLLSGDSIWLTLNGFRKRLVGSGKYTKDAAEELSDALTRYIYPNRPEHVENFMG